MAGGKRDKRNQLFRTEQRSAGWMKDLLHKYSRPVERISNLSFVTFASAKACLELPQHSHYLSCKDDVVLLHSKYGGASSEGCKTILEWEVK